MSKPSNIARVLSRSSYLATIALSLFLAGCEAVPALYAPATAQLEPADFVGFADYQAQANAHLRDHRIAVDGFDPEDQLAWNLPFEKLPASRCAPQPAGSVGILLVHGLSDSPFVFRDMAEVMAERCVLVRTLLLQGHGTRPGDLVEVQAGVWRDQVRQHFDNLSARVDHAFIGGFSLGGGLATELALGVGSDSGETSSRPAGLLAIAPVWELNGLRDYLWMAPYAALVTDFVEREPEQNPVKYESLAINAAVQIADVRKTVQEALHRREEIAVPLMLVATEGDSVINLEYLVEQFTGRFSHSGNRMVVYRDTRRPLVPGWADERIVSLNSYLPDQRILELSHMSLNIAPDNILYGYDGPLNRCLEPNGLSLQACQALPEDQLWFGAWHAGAREVHTSRLTFNPYFDQLMEEIGAFMERAVVGMPATAERPDHG